MSDIFVGIISGLVAGLLLGFGLLWWLDLQMGILRGWKGRMARYSVKKFIPSRSDSKPSPHLAGSSQGRSVLVPLRSNMAYPEQAIRTGLELALSSGQPLNFIVFLEVPRTFNLESGLEDQLEEAFQLLERAEQEAHQAGVNVRTSATKVRNYFLGVVDTALELKAGLIILEQPGDSNGLNQSGISSQITQLTSKTGCNVLLLTRATSQAAILSTNPGQISSL